MKLSETIRLGAILSTETADLIVRAVDGYSHTRERLLELSKKEIFHPTDIQDLQAELRQIAEQM